MNSKKWIKISISTALLGFSLLAIFNYSVDPFNIFHTQVLKENLQSNERFNKIEYLEKNHQNFNGYMIGSSRIGTTAPKEIEAYIPNSKFYNMTMNGATLYDYKMHLRYMIEQNYAIETIYLQLDVDTMNYYGHSEADYLSKLHPYVEEKSLAFYYFEYLSGFFPMNAKMKIEHNLNPVSEVDHLLDTGIWTNNHAEEKMQKDCKAYTDNIKEFHTDYRRLLKYSKRNETLRDIKEIVSLCKTKHIKLYTFVMPHNKKMMDSFVLEDYLDYLNDIGNMTDFYDFSGYNAVTNNHCNYYELSHYRPLVGKLIAARIFKNKKIDIPRDFGTFVTKKTLQTHIQERRKNILNHDKKENYDKY